MFLHLTSEWHPKRNIFLRNILIPLKKMLTVLMAFWLYISIFFKGDGVQGL